MYGAFAIQTKRPYSGPPRPSGPRPAPRPRLSGYKKPDQDEGGLRINDNITVDRIRLIDENGEMIGVSTVREGLRRAEEAGLDLVEISPNAEPPVCKVMDYGKYKYEQQKKANEARKKQKVVEVKELKFRPAIGDHDYNVKLKAARSFLQDGDKVKVTMRFRGREMENKSFAFELINRLKADLADLSKVEMDAKFEGRQMIMVLASAAAEKVVEPAKSAPTEKPAE